MKKGTAVVEASTTQRESKSSLRLDEWLARLFEARATSEDVMDWQEPEPISALDYLGTESASPHPMPSINDSWIGKSVFPLTRSPAFAGSDTIWWQRIPSNRTLVELTMAEGLDHRLVWHHGNGPGLEDRTSKAAFALQSRGTNRVYTNVVTMAAPTLVEKWATLLDDQTICHDVVVDYEGQRHLAAKLWSSFEDYPIEDGMEHPAEKIIAEALLSAKEQHVLDWLSAFCIDASQPSFAASVLRCIGRHNNAGTVSWRVGLVRDGLTADKVEIRDAAVQAAESWGDSDLLDVLRSHSEPEPWLQQYIFDVIDDLAR